jgi:tRNA pseudouridine13 synthase
MDLKIKCKNEDFEVTEFPVIPSLVEADQAKYTYLWIERSGITNFDALIEMKNFFRLSHSSAATPGRKDEDAVAYHMAFVEKVVYESDIAEFNNKYKNKEFKLRIQKILGYGKTPASGHHGNGFRIVVRDLQESLATKIHGISGLIRMVNYFDNQRFGLPGGPYESHLMGKAIVEGDWSSAYNMFQKMNQPENKNSDLSKYKDFEFFKRIDPTKVAFLVTAYNSSVWNDSVSSIIRSQSDCRSHHFKHVGDLSLPHDINALPNTVVGIEGYKLDIKTFAVQRAQFVRDMVATTRFYPISIQDDDMHAGKYKVTVNYFLPPTSYATMMLRQAVEQTLTEKALLF